MLVSERDGVVLVELSGVVEQPLDFNALASRAVLMNLQHTRRITSFGVRAWRTGINVLSPPVYFIGARPLWVAHFNTTAGFAGCGELLSLFLPYACQQCKNFFEVLWDRRVVGPFDGSSRVPQPQTCPRCRGSADFDDVPNAYFACCARQALTPRSPALDALIDSEHLRASAPT
ncbi:MAG: hypothetical protein IT381_32685 [Deltaproteobacteria bacterium]|nr:hypothetical protein [Deltaproteobacteria bacterium]